MTPFEFTLMATGLGVCLFGALGGWVALRFLDRQLARQHARTAAE